MAALRAAPDPGGDSGASTPTNDRHGLRARGHLRHHPDAKRSRSHHGLFGRLAEETDAILHFLAKEISLGCYVNIMDQYHPAGRADDFADLGRTVSAREYQLAVQRAKKYGLTRLDSQNFAHLLRQFLDK